MRYILGCFVALAVTNLTGIVERAYAQTPQPDDGPGSACSGHCGGCRDAVPQNLVPGGTTTRSTVTNPANANPGPGIPGTVTSTPATTTTATTNAVRNPTSRGR